MTITESHRVITWRTTKTATGYQYRVYSFGYQMPEITLKTGECPTRAQATSRAKRWSLYCKRHKVDGAL